MRIHATLRQLRIFHAVARLGNSARAAEALNVSQSAVATQIRQLADSVGLPLLRKTSHGFEPTPTGRELYRTCEALFGEWSRFEEVALETRSLRRGELAIACAADIAGAAAGLVARFRERFPGVVASLDVVDTEELVRRLGEARDDLYLVAEVPRAFEVQATRYFGDSLVPIAPKNHRWAQGTRIALAEFARGVLVARRRGEVSRAVLERLLSAHGLVPPPPLEADTEEAVAEAVARGVGPGVVLHHTLMGSAARDQVALPAVEGFPAGVTWYAVRPPGAASPAVTAFLAFMADEAAPADSAKA